jgi:formylglycine-generating enzyme required for sulfatase activity
MNPFVVFISALLLVVSALTTSVFAQVLTPERELALKPKDVFKECGQCPELVVLVPDGAFTMGSPVNEKERDEDEGPQHTVTFGRAFAVGKYLVTFEEWDACVEHGGCKTKPDDQRWGRGRRPVINVSWNDAQEYVSWLSRRTGKPYWLLSEAEWEYAARAGNDRAYSWGDEIGQNAANCEGCGSQWDKKQTAPVGSFAANPFGLHDMHGNVWEWVEDCYKNSYEGAPADGTDRESENCTSRVARGGSWDHLPRYLRSANRGKLTPDIRSNLLGFRVGRALAR